MYSEFETNLGSIVRSYLKKQIKGGKKKEKKKRATYRLFCGCSFHVFCGKYQRVGLLDPM
jgi:hypothetical protein